MRQHGLQAPLDPHQVGSWLLFLVLVSGVYAFYVPMVEDEGPRWFLFALYTVLALGMTALDLYTSYLDPSDPGLKGATDGEFFCGLCQASVARNSKHCRACDRCVENFDHHCKWLNNCVGRRNYKHFFALVSSTVSMLVVQLAWGLWLFVLSFTVKADMQLRVEQQYNGTVNYVGWQVALAVYMVLLIASIVMLGELLFFHIVLIAKGMSTYDYIIAQRDARLATPAPEPKGVRACCQGGKVADANTTKRRVHVGINPCAALMTKKQEGALRDREAAASGKKKVTAAAGMGGSGSGSLTGKQSGSLNSAAGMGQASSSPSPGKAVSENKQQQSVQDLINQAVLSKVGFDDNALVSKAKQMDCEGDAGGAHGGQHQHQHASGMSCTECRSAEPGSGRIGSAADGNFTPLAATPQASGLPGHGSARSTPTRLPPLLPGRSTSPGQPPYVASGKSLDAAGSASESGQQPDGSGRARPPPPASGRHLGSFGSGSGTGAGPAAEGRTSGSGRSLAFKSPSVRKAMSPPLRDVH